MAALSGATIASTFSELLRMGNSTLHATTGYYIKDAADTNSALSIATTRVGIGTAAPGSELDVRGEIRAYDDTVGMAIYSAAGTRYQYQTQNILAFENANGVIRTIGSLDLALQTNSNTRMTILSGGNVGIGTTAPASQLEITNTTTSSASQGGTLFLSANDGAVMGSGDRLGVIAFVGNEDGVPNTQRIGGQIEVLTDAVWSDTENGADMLFYTNDADNSITEKMRIDAEGLVGIGITTYDDNLSVRGSKVRIIKVIDTAASSASTYFIEGQAVDNSELNFQVTTAGIVKAQSTSITELDYAEFFESVDGRAIARGTTVVLIDGKVQAAKEGESPFGVVRPNGTSSVVGGEPLEWAGKYLKDNYGVYLKEDDGRKKLNPDFVENLDEDGEQIYARRADRDEWQIVGLLGQVQIEKGQPVASSWIKMKEVSDSVDMYYIFPCAQVVNDN